MFSFQSWTKADDIRDFEIEGMSIGDSALSFYSKNLIDNIKSYYRGSKKYYKVSLEPPTNTDKFERIQMHILEADNSYIIHSISGLIFYEDKKNSKSECLKDQNEIINDISINLSSTKKSEREIKKLEQDKTGKSTTNTIYFDFKLDQTEFIKVGCVFYGKEFFENLDIIHAWEEIKIYLTKLRSELTQLIDLNFDKESETTFNQIKNLPTRYYNKLFSDDELYTNYINLLFPEKTVLIMLLEHFKSKITDNSSYKETYKFLNNRLK